MRIYNFFKSIIFLSGLLFVTIAGDIDSTRDNCNHGNKTTQETLQCLSESLVTWDAQLNKAYKDLQKVLSKDGREKLKISQLKWIAFRDTETQFIDNSYAPLKGSIYKVYQIQHKVELTRIRAIQLKQYFAEINEAKGEI